MRPSLTHQMYTVNNHKAYRIPSLDPLRPHLEDEYSSDQPVGTKLSWHTKLFVSILLALAYAHTAFGAHHEALIKDALSAAPPTLVDSVSVVDWDGNVLRQGTSEYTCMPTPPNVAGTQPMCLDGPWKTWADAWSNKKPLDINTSRNLVHARRR
ncbi:MAG: hypothetical protein CM1200mP9_11010 [Gammaproteobacteria bacterium]|nr:MAG: hypothetical protein CM1200mP9_11010 [Gammaproteobacteria bacterium]